MITSEEGTKKDMKGFVANRTGGKAYYYCMHFLMEVAVRIVLFGIFIQLERIPAFKRQIPPEELWLYKNPPTKDYAPASIVLPASFVVPFTIICLGFLVNHDRYDFLQGINAITLSFVINAVLTSLLKITVGRPRPDFFYRCFPNGQMIGNMMQCNGDPKIVNEGRKSFPSGHSSFIFTGFGFIFLYLAGKLNVFNAKGRGQSWRLCLSIIPLVAAMMVGISRTCDYHHHWEDVVVGSLLGMTITTLCYRQYYPSIFSSNPDKPYSIKTQSCPKYLVTVSDTNSAGEEKPLLEEEKQSKWI